VAEELKKRKQSYKRSVDNMRQRHEQLEQVRRQREDMFEQCFDHIKAQIDPIYKVRLLQSAYLSRVFRSARAIWSCFIGFSAMLCYIS